MRNGRGRESVVVRLRERAIIDGCEGEELIGSVSVKSRVLVESIRFAQSEIETGPSKFRIWRPIQTSLFNKRVL